MLFDRSVVVTHDKKEVELFVPVMLGYHTYFDVSQIPPGSVVSPAKFKEMLQHQEAELVERGIVVPDEWSAALLKTKE